MSKFEVRRRVFIVSSAMTLVNEFNISSSRIAAIGSVNRSFAEFDRSLSCHNEIFSNETSIRDLRSLASEETFSLLMGLRFTGTALLPI